MFRLGILNVHPSLLPRHRGASPIPATILAGDPAAGVSVIRMDAGMDTGPIVAAADWPLDPGATTPALEAQSAREGADLVRSVLAGWIAGSLTARPQDEERRTMTRPCAARTGASTCAGRPSSSSARSAPTSRGLAASSRPTPAG